MILVSRNTLYAGTKRKIFEIFGDYSICRSRYMPVTDCRAAHAIFEKSPTWWHGESGLPCSPGYKKCRNERFRPRAFQKIKNYQNRVGENFSVIEIKFEFLKIFKIFEIFENFRTSISAYWAQNCLGFGKMLQNAKKFFQLYSFSFEMSLIRFSMPKVNKICNCQKI